MIAYFPEIYPDELVYSWCSRYYAHSGYPNYNAALEDLFGDKIYRMNYEFTGCFCKDAKTVIEKIIDNESLIIEHTMFPYYARFTKNERRVAAFTALAKGEHIAKLLPNPSCNGTRYLMYCPQCAGHDRETYGETYFHRTHQIRHIKLCPYHSCLLLSTGIPITSNCSPRLYVAEEVISQNSTSDESSNPSELSIARYMAEVFKLPIPTSDMAPIGDYLTYRLNGTPYMSATGFMRQTAKLYRDMRKRYAFFPYKQHHIEKALIGQSLDPHLIILIAFHLGINSQDLNIRSIPASYRIITRTREPSSYSTRKGAHAQDWAKVDKNSLPRVREIIKTLHTDSTGRPRRVTLRAVCDAMGWPDKRLELLPLCKAEVNRYQETMPQYWAREIVWAYKKLQDNNTKINWRAIRDLTNIRRCNFLAAQPLLCHYIDSENCTKIRNL